jgi:hypothetical protein
MRGEYDPQVRKISRRLEMKMCVGKQSCSSRWSSSTACLKVAVLLAICCAPIYLLAQDQRLSQYAHRAWLVRDGVFNDAVATVAQTTDGYIWVGTASGLYRFDGFRFEPWSSPDGKQLPSHVILSLLGARDGSLWIGMTGGLAHFVDHKLALYPNFHDDVDALLEGRPGTIWFARSEAGGALRTPICQALPAQIRCLGESDGLTTKVCCPRSLSQDTEGYLWATLEARSLPNVFSQSVDADEGDRDCK